MEYLGSDSRSPSTSAEYEYATVSSAPPKRPAGRTKFRETRHPVYKGVRRRGSAGRWVCEVREPNKKSRIWLGTFPTAEMAARAHDVAAIALRGRSACLNFADSASLLPALPRFSSTKDIQRAAVEAAEAFRPSPERGNVSTSGTAAAQMESSSEGAATPVQPSEGTIGGGDSDHGVDVMFYDDMGLGMHGFYYTSMGETLLEEPPPAVAAGGWENSNWAEAETGADVSLWSYSI
ncbi:dehydration-responsive element-binding protein 1C-like [Phoenix dactylifera]|uniref:Dehydration-responsive element-binding protein 1C-like n=1 Tax=Phoenix dactylifera TaxID=42345 RepID=A0A8B7CS28_PHODC|nr:dehydration-responsive element-binding protein 1C-like [Phoenix dactylifera]